MRTLYLKVPIPRKDGSAHANQFWGAYADGGTVRTLRVRFTVGAGSYVQ